MIEMQCHINLKALSVDNVNQLDFKHAHELEVFNHIITIAK